MSMMLYGFNGIVCSGICYYLYKLPSLQLVGLKTTLLALFLSLAIYQLGWAFHIILFGVGVPVNSIAWYAINTPFTFALLNLIAYLKNIE